MNEFRYVVTFRGLFLSDDRHTVSNQMMNGSGEDGNIPVNDAGQRETFIKRLEMWRKII